MDTNYLENNYLTLVGKVTGEKNLVMKFMEKDFMYLILEIPRLSGNDQILFQLQYQKD